VIEVVLMMTSSWLVTDDRACRARAEFDLRRWQIDVRGNAYVRHGPTALA
jgi:hypothetical protein